MFDEENLFAEIFAFFSFTKQFKAKFREKIFAIQFPFFARNHMYAVHISSCSVVLPEPDPHGLRYPRLHPHPHPRHCRHVDHEIQAEASPFTISVQVESKVLRVEALTEIFYS